MPNWAQIAWYEIDTCALYEFTENSRTMDVDAVKVMTPEYLSNDIFDEDFLKTFFWLYRMQYVMGSCRLDTRNRFATPPTISQKCYTILCILLTGVVNYALADHYTSIVSNPIIRYLGICSLIIQYISFVLNILHARFMNNDKNVEFYVMMQKIDRLLKIDRWTVLNEWVRKFTNIPVACMLIIFVIFMVIGCAEQSLLCIYFFGPAYSILVVVSELIACSSIISSFVFRIRFINILMENHLSQEIVPKADKSFISRKFIRYYAQKTNHYYETSETCIYLQELIKCFTMYQDLYRFQLFIFCIQSVVDSLVTFELLLFLMQESQTTLFDITSYVMFAIMDIFVALCLAIRYELFFQEVKETKRLCINVMSRNHEGPLREKALRMLKMIDETPPRFSVYEMWEMNAATFVAMFSLITSLIVTLLQFAFL